MNFYIDIVSPFFFLDRMTAKLDAIEDDSLLKVETKCDSPTKSQIGSMGRSEWGSSNHKNTLKIHENARTNHVGRREVGTI